MNNPFSKRKLIPSNGISKDSLCHISAGDSLLSSCSTSQVSNLDDSFHISLLTHKRLKKKGIHLIAALFMIIIATSSLVWTPFNIMLAERLKMTPGLPPYEWWKNPPEEVLLRMYVFNITNSEEYLNHSHSKLNLQEIGPIIYREKLIHTYIRFNSNGTMTYKAKRMPIFIEQLNKVDMNATLFVPNLSLLGIASYFWDASIFTKAGFNILTRKFDTQPIVETTVYNYLWNFSDPLLDVAEILAPRMVPVKNMGVLSRIYDDFEDTVTVFIGATYGHNKFFLIDKYDHSEYLPGHQGNCADKIVNSSEGVLYPQFLTKASNIFYWRKTICRATKLKYISEEMMYGVKAYKFILPKTAFDRTSPTTQDCYKGYPALENGLSDVSPCYYDFPMAASFPHFLHVDESTNIKITGLSPNETKHGSFVLIEPITGIPLESKARSQSNLVLKNLSGFSERIQKFSNMVLPMFWAEYNQVGLPWYISGLMYFTVNVVPLLQIIFSCALFLTAFYFILKFASLVSRS